MRVLYKELILEIPREVYEPAEDSFMLANAAGRYSKDKEVLEIGCGSGIASLAAAKSGATDVLGVDISQDAVDCANKNAKSNKLSNVRFFVSDLFSKIPKKKFDVILFNPPYLPTGQIDKLNGPLNFAFDGGKDGRKILDVFLPRFDRYLKKGGCLLLVQSDLNGPIKTRRILKKMGYSVDVAEKESFFFESVYIYRAIKNHL